MPDVRLIDANALRVVPDYGGTVARGYGKTIHEVLFAVQQFIDNAPTVDAVPVVHGAWMDQDYTFTRFTCTACGSKNHGECTNYCPNCGAKMDGGAADGSDA